MIEKALSRKDFLKAGGIGIAGAALFGVAGGASDGRIVRIQLDEGADREVRALDVEGEPGLFVVLEGPMEGQELFVCTADELEAPRGRRAQACPTLTCRHSGPGRLKPVGRGARKTSDGQIVERNWFEWELLLKDSNAWRPMEGLTGYERQTRWLEWVFHHSLGLTAYGVWINVYEPGALASYDSTFQWLPWEGYRCGGTTNALGCTGNGGAAPGRGTIWTTMRTGEVEALTFEEQKMSRYHKGPLHEMEHAIEGFNHGQLLVAGYEEEGAGTLMGCSPPGVWARPGDIYRGRQFKRGEALHR